MAEVEAGGGDDDADDADGDVDGDVVGVGERNEAGWDGKDETRFQMQPDRLDCTCVQVGKEGWTRLCHDRVLGRSHQTRRMVRTRHTIHFSSLNRLPN